MKFGKIRREKYSALMKLTDESLQTWRVKLWVNLLQILLLQVYCNVDGQSAAR
jgi:hypothetical protein